MRWLSRTCEIQQMPSTQVQRLPVRIAIASKTNLATKTISFCHRNFCIVTVPGLNRQVYWWRKEKWDEIWMQLAIGAWSILDKHTCDLMICSSIAIWKSNGISVQVHRVYIRMQSAKGLVMIGLHETRVMSGKLASCSYTNAEHRPCSCSRRALSVIAQATAPAKVKLLNLIICAYIDHRSSRISLIWTLYWIEFAFVVEK